MYTCAERVDELIRVNYDVPDHGGVDSGNTLERINCLFDAVSPSRERGNCFTVPDEYTVGDIAKSDTLKLFAEYAVPVVRQKQNPYVTPVRKGRKSGGVQKKGTGGAAAAGVSKKKAEVAVKKNEKVEVAVKKNKTEVVVPQNGSAKIVAANTLKNQKKKERRKRKRDSVKNDMAAKVTVEESSSSESTSSSSSSSEEEENGTGPQVGEGSKAVKVPVVTKKKSAEPVKKQIKVDVKEGVAEKKEKKTAQQKSGPTAANEKKAEQPVTAPAAAATESKMVESPKKVKKAVESPKKKKKQTEKAAVEELAKAPPAPVVKQSEKKTEAAPAPSSPSSSDTSSSSSSSSKSSSSSEENDKGTEIVIDKVEPPAVASPKKQEPSPQKAPAPAPSSSSDESSSSSDDSSSSSDDSSSSSSADGSSSSSDEEVPATQPSGKFDGADGGVLTQLLQSASKGDAASKMVNIDDLKKNAEKQREESAQREAQNAPQQSFQWQKPHTVFKADPLVKLCRIMVTDAVNHERKAKGLQEVPPTKLYRDKENKPDWWPFAHFTAGSFDKKKDAIVVYDIARKVLAAIYKVDLED